MYDGVPPCELIIFARAATPSVNELLRYARRPGGSGANDSLFLHLPSASTPSSSHDELPFSMNDSLACRVAAGRAEELRRRLSGKALGGEALGRYEGFSARKWAGGGDGLWENEDGQAAVPALDGRWG